MQMQQSGDVAIGFQPLGALPNFFRLVVLPKTRIFT